MNIAPKIHDCRQLAFTLVEMITVIAIMGIVAALVVTMGVAASQKKKMTVVAGEMQKIRSMIASYQTKLNYFPPDNGLLATINPAINPALYDGLAATNPLIYELTGATNTSNGASLYVFNSSNNVPTLSTAVYSNIFNRGGVANGDASEPHNFFQPGPSSKEYGNYGAGSSGTLPVCGLVVPVDYGPGVHINFWRYDSSSTNRHNMNSYDLWAVFSIGSKNGVQTMITNGNW